MTECCGKNRPAQPCAEGAAGAAMHHFSAMIERCVEHCRKAKAQGRPVVGIMCEYTPREVIMAAGGVPVCLCGGSAGTMPAAEEVLPSNLCPLIKSTFGYHLLKTNPMLETADLIVAETTCDGKKKMYELMGRTRSMYVLELPQKQDDLDALRHWRREVVKFKEHLEQAFGVKIGNERLKEAIALMNRERGLRRALAELAACDPPKLTGRQLLALKSSVSGICEDLACYEELLKALKDAPAGKAARGGVRVLLTGVPIVHGAERVLEIIESCGGVVAAMENCTGLKPIMEDVDPSADDPLQAIADKYFHLPCSVQTPNPRRIELLNELVRQYRPQCVIELVWQACLTYDVEAALIKRWAEEAGLSYLKLTTDYSPSDSARITMRVEALLETVRGGARP